jgi:cytochrome b561
MQPRYSNLNQILHWVTAVCMLAILPLAWVMTNAEQKTPGLHAMYNWHKTLGLIVLLVTAFRIVWRFIDKPPAYPQPLAAWDKGLAHAVYWLFFATLLWMPITGAIMSMFGTHPTVLFNLIPLVSPFAPNAHLEDQFGYLHALGQWAVYGLILLHLAGVAMHLIWKRDGVVGRILPPYRPRRPRRAPSTKPRWLA